VTRPFSLRLAAVVAAAATVLPAVAAHAAPGDGADGARPVTPPTRALDLACPAERVDGAAFTDIADSAHGDSIRCLSWYGITSGGSDGTFGADRAVTRAQMATFLAKVLAEAGVELPAAPADAFTDDEGSAHEANLDALAALGIVSGSGNGTVNPDAPVRRDQMAAFLVRLLELVTDEELADAVEDYFDDDDDNTHRGPINALAGLGIAAGRAQGVFDPSSDVKRAQMATFLMRLIDRLVERGDVRVPATLVLSAEEVAPGDVVEAAVLGDGVAAVELAGCGLDGPVTDLATATPGIQFTITVPAAWPVEAPADGAESGGAEGSAPTDGAEGSAPADGAPADGAESGPSDDLTTAGEGSGSDDADECELLALVTFEDGSTEELDGELEFRGAEDTTEDEQAPTSPAPVEGAPTE
jgi:hypothetical protein